MTVGAARHRGFLRERSVPPQIERKQRVPARSHGVTDVGPVVDRLPRGAIGERPLALSPGGDAGQRQVEFLRHVMMIGIGHARTENQETRCDDVIGKMPARAEQLHPAVIVQEVLAEIRGRVCLAPTKRVALVGQQADERPLPRLCDFAEAVEVAEAIRDGLTKAGYTLATIPQLAVAE